MTALEHAQRTGHPAGGWKPLQLLALVDGLPGDIAFIETVIVEPFLARLGAFGEHALHQAMIGIRWIEGLHRAGPSVDVFRRPPIDVAGRDKREFALRVYDDAEMMVFELKWILASARLAVARRDSLLGIRQHRKRNDVAGDEAGLIATTVTEIVARSHCTLCRSQGGGGRPIRRRVIGSHLGPRRIDQRCPHRDLERKAPADRAVAVLARAKAGLPAGSLLFAKCLLRRHRRFPHSKRIIHNSALLLWQ